MSIDPRLGEALDRLRDPAAIDAPSALSLWSVRDPEAWARVPDVYRLLGDRLVKLGEPLMAFDVISEGLARFPGDVRLRQLHASALARSGATVRANLLLQALAASDHEDPETLGLLGRTHKDLATQAADPERRTRHLTLAFGCYTEAYRMSRAPWARINAATTAALLGDMTTAITLARELFERVREELGRPQPPGDRYWLLATLGEASLILGEWADAASWYGQALAEAGHRFGDICSTRRNARLLIEHLGGDGAVVEQALKIPSVLVFVGHMIDRPGRPTARFPASLEPAVAAAIRQRIRSVSAGFAFASAACGSDIMLLEAMLEIGGELHVVLPYEREQFVRDSVDLIPGARWPARFDAVLTRTVEVVTASTYGLEGGIAYEYSNLTVLGLATLRARQLDTDLVTLAVWNGRPGDGPGGTAWLVERSRALGHRVDVIDLAKILADHATAAVVTGAAARLPPPASAPSRVLEASIVAMLFADAVGFSKLSDRQIPRFVDDFLGTIAALVASSSHAPLMKNTWGDGLYFVFANVREAGLFALDLCDRINETSWTSRGLPASLSLRIALHSGPVYACIDPITRQPNYLGVHVSQAARIEPITPPGHVYASQAFAAIAAAHTVREFACDYVGQTSLAKGYGTFPTYHVRRA